MIKKAIQFNAMQLMFAMSRQRIKIGECGRGSGKTLVLAYLIIKAMSTMSQAHFSFATDTFKNALSNTLPSLFDSFEKLGYYRDVHYVVGKAPPKGWKIPFSAPGDWKHTITFWNGFAFSVVSQDKNAGGARGATRNGAFIDEIQNIQQEWYNVNIRMTIRADHDRSFADSDFFHSITGFGTVPLEPSGRWVWKFEDMARRQPDEAFYLRSPSTVNYGVIGKQWFKDALLTSGRFLYDTEIMNIRPPSITDSFYPKYNPEHHCYSPNNSKYLSLDLDTSPRSVDSSTDSDCDPNQLLSASVDWGNSINIMVVVQDNPKEMKFLNVLWVKNPDILQDLAAKFVEYYKQHKTKVLNLYGDRNGNSGVANSKLTFFEQFKGELERKGWVVALKTKGLDPDHMDKYRVVNEVLEGKRAGVPAILINRTNCKPLTVSISTTKTITTEKGFKKDKRDERKPVDQLYTTHASDAFDIMVYAKCAKLVGKRRNYGVTLIS